MSNPWTKKNPLMSVWMSAANRVAGSARAQVTAAAKRESAAVQADIGKQMLQFWTGGAAKLPAKKRTRR